MTAAGEKQETASCFVEVGIGPRASRQIYDRGHSAISQIKEGEIDWNKVFENAGWFHTTGITCAISPQGAAEAVALAQNREGVRPDHEFRPELPLHAVVAR